MLPGLKTCVEVFNALQDNENKGCESTDSQDNCSRIESSEKKVRMVSFSRRCSEILC